MIHYLARAIQIIAALGAVSAIAYYGLCLWSAVRFLRDRKAGEVEFEPSREAARVLPPVSILKPLKGMDPEIYESFRSHCRQDYPEYEIIFGVSDADDPAIESVERLKREFPDRAIRLVVCREILGANVKVSNLVQMLPTARYDYLIVNDSDIQVESDYLRRVLAPLADPKVGMVTCLYRGIAGPTLGSRLEAVGISTDFCGGVLAARLLERGIRFGLGSTLAFRRTDLQTIGGFESFVDYLADDYEMGARIAERGLEVRLADVVVETFLPPYDLRGYLDHQLRWARSVRDSRPWGYVGLVFTFGLLWALLALIAGQGAGWAWTVFGAAVVLRLAVVGLVGRVVLRDRQIPQLLWLLPLRDLLAGLVWLGSFVGHTVVWRGERFRLKDGKLARVWR